MATQTPPEVLNKLFPLPAQSGTNFSPTQNPGVTLQGAEALARLLKENHEKTHVFFNDRGFHNHISHHLLADYALGATGPVLDAAFNSAIGYQRKAFDSPGEINAKNWTEHLGDEKYWRSYVKFFTGEVLEKGMGPTLETFCFSPSSNVESSKDPQNQPAMLNRFISGVLHPLIHAGYGFEFEIPGMVVEGLAMAAVTATDSDEIVPAQLFATDSTGTLSRLTAALSLTSSAQPSKKGSLHLLEIAAKMLEDEGLAAGKAFEVPTEERAFPYFPYTPTMKNKAEVILKAVDEWDLDVSDPNNVKERLEHLSWFVTILYGITGLQPGKDFKADFFTMHLVTSSLFMHSYVKYLKPQSQDLLLRTYLGAALAVWIARGRPAINIANFYEKSTLKVNQPGPQPTPDENALAPTDTLHPNPWLPLLQTTLMHPNEHLPKLQRALAHYAAVYGHTPAGKFAHLPRLPDADKIDGTLFVRVAILTADKLGWVREGQSKEEWDFSGFWN